MKLPVGFLTSGVNCGIKDNNNKDLGLILCDQGTTSFAFFTTNSIKSDTITISSERIKKTKDKIRAVLVISGNALCCCENAKTAILKITDKLSQKLKVKNEEIILLATGKIGVPLNYNKVIDSIPKLISEMSDDVEPFAKAITTTDRKIKICENKSSSFRSVGVAKGAGMIKPNYATTLSFFFTDTKPKVRKTDLLNIVNSTIGRINIDMCQSTNDSALLFFSGKKDADSFSVLNSVNQIFTEVAQKIVEDGEGATKSVQLIVKEAKNDKEANIVADSVSNSLLFRCSIFGSSPDFGRILSSIGATRLKIEKERIFIYLSSKNQKTEIVKNGIIVTKSLKKASEIMKNRNYEIEIKLGNGKGKGKSIFCDISPEYIDINKESEIL